MSIATVLPNIRIEDVPKQEAHAFKGVGTVGEVTLRDVANNYVQITVPLTYTKENGNESTFHARYNLKAHWLTTPASQLTFEGSEKIQYDINMSGLTRGLFSSAGIETGTLDFNALTGKAVGFKTKTRRDDPSKLDISFFYKPKS